MSRERLEAELEIVTLGEELEALRPDHNSTPEKRERWHALTQEIMAKRDAVRARFPREATGGDAAATPETLTGGSAHVSGEEG